MGKIKDKMTANKATRDAGGTPILDNMRTSIALNTKKDNPEFQKLFDLQNLWNDPKIANNPDLMKQYANQYKEAYNKYITNDPVGLRKYSTAGLTNPSEVDSAIDKIQKTGQYFKKPSTSADIVAAQTNPTNSAAATEQQDIANEDTKIDKTALQNLYDMLFNANYPRYFDKEGKATEMQKDLEGQISKQGLQNQRQLQTGMASRGLNRSGAATRGQREIGTATGNALKQAGYEGAQKDWEKESQLLGYKNAFFNNLITQQMAQNQKTAPEILNVLGGFIPQAVLNAQANKQNRKYINTGTDTGIGAGGTGGSEQGIPQWLKDQNAKEEAVKNDTPFQSGAALNKPVSGLGNPTAPKVVNQPNIGSTTGGAIGSAYNNVLQSKPVNQLPQVDYAKQAAEAESKRKKEEELKLRTESLKKVMNPNSMQSLLALRK